jgi:antitoxin component YwqK of YwqJK toxin-antitoxin module
MPKCFLLISVLFGTVLFAQDYEPRPIDLPDFEKMDKFFRFRDEILPEDFTMKLEDIRKIPVNKKNKLVEEIQGSHTVIKLYVDGKIVLKQPYNQEGLPDGTTTAYHPNGKVRQEIPYVNGKANGTGKAYSDDGFIKAETSYKNNTFHGLRKIYAPRGGGIEGNFQDGKATGKIKVQDSEGVVYYYPPDMKTAW